MTVKVILGFGMMILAELAPREIARDLKCGIVVEARQAARFALEARLDFLRYGLGQQGV